MITTGFENFVYSITLDRPEKHNAFDAEMIKSITEAVQKVPADTHLVLFSGNGKSFCAGADVNYMRAQATQSDEQNREDAKKLALMFEAIYQLAVPTVVYAHGNIFGGGLGILAACDIAIAEGEAKFCFSEVKLGIIPAVISPFVLRKTGVGFARRYFQSGEIFTAEIAEKAGLISERISGSKSAETLARLLAALTTASKDAQKSVKRLLRSYENFEPMSRDQLIHELAKLRSSEDAQSRMKDFLEKTKK